MTTAEGLLTLLNIGAGLYTSYVGWYNYTAVGMNRWFVILSILAVAHFALAWERILP